MTIAHLQELLTLAEFASRIRQSESSIRRKIGDGTIAAFRVGELGPFRIPAWELEQHLRPVGRGRVAGSEKPAAQDRFAPEREAA